MISLLPKFRSCLRHLWSWLGVAEHHLVLAWRLLLRDARLSLRSALSLRKQILVLEREGAHPAGLFAEFCTVLGMLEHYETWRSRYAGVKVNFRDQGLYYDPEGGENWWEYYFEPIDIGGSEGSAGLRVIDTYQRVHFALRTARKMNRAGGHRLIGKYVRVRSHIQREVDSFVRENFEGAHVIGIHYRGTDKSAEALRVPYETVLAAVQQKLLAADAKRRRLFLASDEQAFLDWMLERFPDELIFRKALRATDGQPLHYRKACARQQGEEAVIDCLLLSRCRFLIRTASNLGLCATFFNPSLPTLLLAQ